MLESEMWPEHLRARVRVLSEHDPGVGHVLYWMRVAARDHENPALDAAVVAANALGVSVLVYHAVSERYPFASDRHHTFMLEGARDVARGLRVRGLPYVLHVERPGARGAHLRWLAERAALVVTEDAPVPPLSEWTKRLAAHLAEKRVPLVAVDASCVVPLSSLTSRYDRAYAFRAASRAIASQTLKQPWVDVAPARPPTLPELPFEPLDAEALDDRAIARLVATCAIDHGVGPVRTLRGGSVAGYARWHAFVESGLASYAARRNDAAVDGTSRLSPWLHYGHVSPLRIAREVAARPSTPSTEKFLDELLVWREAAWHFAAHTPNLHSLEVLPPWARATLEAHASDPREVVPPERLDEGRTGNALWDLAQRSLVVQGELHNNVRMTWGKAIPQWTRSPEDARRALVELNHRYALDGRDPSSYGGLYWCLGLFDRPFAPEQPVLGTVRPRPTVAHENRLDLARYAARVSRPARDVGRVAIVGAGLSGLACARALLLHGVDVTVFDKGRVPGGRLASYRSPELSADLGAQYFTARDPRFRRFVDSWLREGVVARWEGRIAALPTGAPAPVETPTQERFVAVPSMSALARHLGQGVPVSASHRVDRAARRGPSITLEGIIGPRGATLGPRREGSDEEPLSFGDFDVLLVCLPPEQAAPLVRSVSLELSESVARVASEPCLALAFSPDGEALRRTPFDGLFIGRDGDDRVLSWLSRDFSKPGRSGAESWVAHAAPEWSAAHFRDPQALVERALLDELARLLALPRLGVQASTLRRWAFARATSPLDGAALFDDEAKVGVGGDWSAGGRVEGAYLAGVGLAGRVLGLPSTMTAPP